MDQQSKDSKNILQERQEELGQVVHKHEPLALSIELGVDPEDVREGDAWHKTIDHVRAKKDPRFPSNPLIRVPFFLLFRFNKETPK